ncbi:hypothetical protein FAF44_34175 [Nonomuraea sp. MG754425]|uniref:thioesterase domain-containing protein n=1 Tax=Nonomuraea sp. MG754425 TaxID=2570319 RepID=UPI001F01AE4A|nr:thioesterase domain-containing protein [Nonomuraea sp. MG754425]MCF6473395.1 hypothetical protein [Nonomuraea sp. MG754425]
MTGYYANRFRDHLEALVADAYLRELSVTSVTARTSLRAANGRGDRARGDRAEAIAARLRSATNVDITGADVRDLDTVEAVAVRLRFKADSASCLELPEDYDPARPALVYFHSASGNAFAIQMLRDELPIQLIGVHAAGLAGEQEIPGSIEQFADVYTEQLAQISGSGKLMLTGFSGGGLIALEVARRLRSAVPLGFVAMFDTPAPAPGEKGLSEADLMEGRLRELLRRVENHMRPSADPKDTEVIATLKKGLALTWDADSDALERQLRVFARVMCAADGYAPAEYRGPVHHFGLNPSMHDAERWSSILPEATFHSIAGEHYEYSIFRNPEFIRTLKGLILDAL